MPSANSTAVAEAAEMISASCLAARVRLLHRTITGIFDGALRPLGLTDAQLTILVMVANRGPIPPGAVSRRLNMEKSTISRNIERMKNSGWLVVADGVSGREKRLTLTTKGEALLVKALPVWDKAQTKATGLLGQRGADSLRNLGNAVWSQIGRN